MKRTFFLTLVFLLCTVCLARASGSEANALESQGIMLVATGKTDEGLALMQKAVQLEPRNALRHMNYGSILMAQGKALFESGDTVASVAALKDAAQELSQALKLFKDSPPERMSRGNCYALLGDIYLYGFGKQEEALGYYRQSLREDPQNVGVAQIAESLSQAK